jgi:small-conductance mechanosensitive channel
MTAEAPRRFQLAKELEKLREALVTLDVVLALVAGLACWLAPSGDAERIRRDFGLIFVLAVVGVLAASLFRGSDRRRLVWCALASAPAVMVVTCIVGYW